jgi:alanine racemase
MSRRRVIARVNVAAIERNCARLRAELAGGCELCVVVKADGYGHGAIESARAALRGGASRLAVAGSSEAIALRAAGAQYALAEMQDVPILVMGPLTEPELREALSARGEVVVWDERHVRAVAETGGGRVHVKLDSGMGRLGTRDAEQALRVADLAARTPGVELAGAMTHFATADRHGDLERSSEEPGTFFERQLSLFQAWAGEVKAAHPDVVVHAANSAAVLREPGSHFDMVRCGIAVYGMDPFGEDPLASRLEPALELCSYVAAVKSCAPGQSAGYGRSFIAERFTHVGVLPIGYGDGWRRALSNDGDSLIGGARRPLVGTVSMDSLTVDLGEEPGARELQGSEAVLIGRQGAERITAEEVAGRLGTINYEITCGLTSRVPRVYHRDGELVSCGDAERQAAAAVSRA